MRAAPPSVSCTISGLARNCGVIADAILRVNTQAVNSGCLTRHRGTFCDRTEVAVPQRLRGVARSESTGLKNRHYKMCTLAWLSGGRAVRSSRSGNGPGPEETRVGQTRGLLWGGTVGGPSWVRPA